MRCLVCDTKIQVVRKRKWSVLGFQFGPLLAEFWHCPNRENHRISGMTLFNSNVFEKFRERQKES